MLQLAGIACCKYDLDKIGHKSRLGQCVDVETYFLATKATAMIEPSSSAPNTDPTITSMSSHAKKTQWKEDQIIRICLKKDLHETVLKT